MEHHATRRWARRRTIINGDRLEDDWIILCDGWTVGRVHLTHPHPHRIENWTWSVQTLPGHSGYIETLADALERVREGVTFGTDGLPESVDVMKMRRGERGHRSA